MADRTRDHAVVHAAERRVAEYGGVDPTHLEAAGVGGAAPDRDRRDHRLAGSGGAGVEPRADTVRMGRQARGAAGTQPSTAACSRRVGRVHAPSGATATPDKTGSMAAYT